MLAKPVINLTSNIYLAFDQLDKEWNQAYVLARYPSSQCKTLTSSLCVSLFLYKTEKYWIQRICLNEISFITI